MKIKSAISLCLFLFMILQGHYTFASSESNFAPDISVIESADSHDSSFYKIAIKAWPDNVSIWDNLKSSKSKLIFLNYLKSIDDTNLRNYKTFENLCTGFASQFFVRFSKYANFQNDELTRMETVGIRDAKYPKKFKIPVFMSSYYGHYFNSVLIDEKNPQNFNSYVLIEPQNDITITRDGNYLMFSHYAERFPVSIDILEKFDDNKRFITKTLYTFVFIDGDKFNLISNKKYAMLLQFLFVAETEKMNFEAELGGRSFSEYFKYKISLFKLNKQELLEIFNLVDGKLFREKKEDEAEPLTYEKFKSITE